MDVDDYFAWLNDDLATVNKIGDLPCWFNTGLYQPTNNFTLLQWIEALALRQLFEPIIADGPIFEDDCEPIRFLYDLLASPLTPNWEAWPPCKDQWRYELSDELGDISMFLGTGHIPRQHVDFTFKTDLSLPDHLLLKCYEKMISHQRALNDAKPHRTKVYDYQSWGRFNFLALVDLSLWAQREKKRVSWDVLCAIADPREVIDRSALRKSIISFFDDVYHEGTSRTFLYAQYLSDR